MKFACGCGHLVSGAGETLPTRAHLLPDTAWFATLDALDATLAALAAGQLSADAASREVGERLSDTLRPVYACGACGRLYVTDPKGTRRAYTPEPPSTPLVLGAG